MICWIVFFKFFMVFLYICLIFFCIFFSILFLFFWILLYILLVIFFFYFVEFILIELKNVIIIDFIVNIRLSRGKNMKVIVLIMVKESDFMILGGILN